MISIIIPHMDDSECIELCKQKIKENTVNEYEIIEIVGTADVGGAYNAGALIAKYDLLLFFSDDMVMAPGWDVNFIKHAGEKIVLTSWLVEPGWVPVNKCNFEQDFGKHPDEFDYDRFIEFIGEHKQEECLDNTTGWFMPFVVRKEDFFGYPNEIPFPYPIDLMLFNKFKERGYTFKRVDSWAYHFQRMSVRKNLEKHTY